MVWEPYLQVLVTCVSGHPKSEQLSKRKGGPLHSSLCNKLYGNADFIYFSRTWHLPTQPEMPVPASENTVTGLPTNLPDLNLKKNLLSIFKRKMKSCEDAAIKGT